MTLVTLWKSADRLWSSLGTALLNLDEGTSLAKRQRLNTTKTPKVTKVAMELTEEELAKVSYQSR